MSSTEQQQAADAMMLAGDVVKLSSCAILQLDQDGHVRSCNAGASTVLGYACEEIRGQPFSVLFSAADSQRSAAEQAVARTLEEGIDQLSMAMVRKDGGRFRASVMLERVADQRGARVLVLIRDITEIFQTQKRVREAQEVALRAQRLDAVGKLTLGLSHDFNNLLSVIGNSLDMLSLRRSGDESVRRILDIAHRAVERGTQLTRQMLAFGRGQTLVPQLSRVDDLVNASLELYRRVCGETIQLNVNLAEKLPPISVDVGQLEAALLNLLSNSRDAMHGVGKVMLSARLESIIVPSGNGEAGQFVCICVGDSGPGIQAELQESVFEPFFTTKSVGDGSGLGLSQVYGFAAQSGGTATIGTSALGGAAVSLYFPVATDVVRAA
ncbi:MAG: two-component system sensor histidine kinase NtrB [Stenotrophomonas sp.]|uniref:two-component system sensor histidine kinase NtrB n=1 Tax=Stenotrophomonas sp. TaxID=69392 RepID=UPI0028A7EC8A|nr:ATP-binding protein [Stenotrophomonas sp.]